jgi:hypothetical protein
MIKIKGLIQTYNRFEIKNLSTIQLIFLLLFSFSYHYPLQIKKYGAFPSFENYDWGQKYFKQSKTKLIFPSRTFNFLLVKTTQKGVSPRLLYIPIIYCFCHLFSPSVSPAGGTEEINVTLRKYSIHQSPFLRQVTLMGKTILCFVLNCYLHNIILSL